MLKYVDKKKTRGNNCVPILRKNIEKNNPILLSGVFWAIDPKNSRRYWHFWKLGLGSLR